MFDCASESDGWIQGFCAIEGNKFFCEVDEDFLRDNFNFYGLRQRIRHFDSALRMILGSEYPSEQELDDSKQLLEVYRDACDLYGLAHARFIISPRGLKLMHMKYQMGTFGTCPRALCSRHPVLPVGISEQLRTARVKVYCPKCQEVYVPPGPEPVDGAYFGPSFPHIFLQTFTSLIPPEIPIPHVSRVFGYRIHNRISIIQGKLMFGEYGRNVPGYTGNLLPDLEPAKPPVDPYLDDAHLLSSDEDIQAKLKK